MELIGSIALAKRTETRDLLISQTLELLQMYKINEAKQNHSIIIWGTLNWLFTEIMLFLSLRGVIVSSTTGVIIGHEIFGIQ